MLPAAAAWPLTAVPPPPGLESSESKPAAAAAPVADQGAASQRARQAGAAAHPGMAANFLQEHQHMAQMAQLRHLQQQLLVQQMTYQQAVMSPSQHGQLQASSTSGEWVNAVLAAAPYMDAERLKKALAILDKAVSNLQQIKALDGIIASTYMAGGIFTAMPHLHAAEHMKAQVFEKQQVLLRQLHCLGACSAAGPCPWPAAMGGGLDVGEPYGQSLDERLLTLLQQDAPLTLPHQLPLPQVHPGGAALDAAPERRMARQQSEGPAAEQARAKPWTGAGGEDYRSSAATRRSVQTLSSSLQALSGEDPDCLFIVRRINKLGFKASKKLKAYFSAYGPVVQVLVAHSTARMQGLSPPYCPRRRPSSLGFVQMATPEGARRVLEAGEEQMVESSVVLIQRFERDRSGAIKEVEEEESSLSTKSMLLEDEGWKRQQSTFSTKSTTFGDDEEAWRRQQSTMSTMSALSASGPLFEHAAEEGSA